MAAKALAEAGVPDPLAEAEFLLTHILKCTRPGLFLEPARLLTDGEAASFKEAVERRKKREPAQYITGDVEFRGHTIKVTRATLIPRPETELVVDEALEAAGAMGGNALVVDLCTGSGCIAISVAAELEGSRVYATDISTAALEVARENAVLNGVAGHVEFLEGDLFAPLPGRLKGAVDIIISNPPYVSLPEMEGLAPEVRDFEPGTALLGGADGLDFLRRIIEEAPVYMKKGGLLIMEIGYSQSEKVREMAGKDGRYEEVTLRKDYSGIERIFSARSK
jgi:release factor glutamine methyltransferase